MRCTKVLEIIGEELHIPHDATLNEMLAYIGAFDKSGELLKLLAEAGTRDLIEKFKEEGIAQ